MIQSNQKCIHFQSCFFSKLKELKGSLRAAPLQNGLGFFLGKFPYRKDKKEKKDKFPFALGRGPL